MRMAITSGDRTVGLRGGGEMPLLGFGTWQIDGEAAYPAVRDALEVGYRHIDTATGYSNEKFVGSALSASGVDREEVFVTTKCPPDHIGRERETLETSLRDLETEYVDLWLIHWPPNGEARPEMWKAFIDAMATGKARAIGVSNYSTAQIDELVDATGVVPAVNQIPWSPSLYDARRAEELAERGIVLEGYSGLRRTRLDDPVIVEVATAHGVTAAQVVIRWHLEHGFVAIPKTVRRERMEENFDVYGFSLSSDEIARIDGLGAAG
jgi:diketogulonate reductase-like aldo/keto reductase